MKACLEIVRVAVLSREDVRTPTKLTVSYKGWWHTPLLRVPLAMEPLCDGVHATRKGGSITLVQRFASGKAPAFRVKDRSSKLVIRLYARRTLRTQAQVEVGHLVSGTAERLLKVPFEVKVGGKVEKAFLVLAQTSPVPTPPPPPIYPVGHKRLSSPPVPQCTFPLGEYEPSQARLRFLVQEMCGPIPDPEEWLVPASTPEAKCSASSLPDPEEQLVPAGPLQVQCSAAEAAPLPLPDPGERLVSTSPPEVGCMVAEAAPLPEETDGEADNSSQECEVSSLGKKSEGAVQENSDSAQLSPQTSPGAADGRYVRLWNAAFGEPAEPSRPREERREERSRPRLKRRAGSFERLWTTVFGDATDCEEEEEHEVNLLQVLCSAAEVAPLPLPDHGERLVSASPPTVRCTVAEVAPLPEETDGEADDGSQEYEASSLEEKSEGAVQESSDSAQCSPHTDPDPHYVRLWNAAFGEPAEPSRPREERREERSRPMLRRRAGSFERLWTTVFGDAADCEEEEQQQQVSPAQAGARQAGQQTRVFWERPAGRRQREASEGPPAEQPAGVSARCVRLWKEVFGEVQ